MRRSMARCVTFILLALLAGCRDPLPSQREDFLLAENYLTENKEPEFQTVSKRLVDYPLYPYLRYQWLLKHLAQTDEVTAFLAPPANNPYVSLLRAKWLDYLAAQQRWPEFVQHYQPDDRSTGDCRWHWAKLQTGQGEKAFADARRIWLSGAESPACRPLFTAWLDRENPTPDLVWQRFENVLSQNKAIAVSAALEMLDGPDRKQAEFWLRLHNNPPLLADQQTWPATDKRAARFFANTLVRLADRDLNTAMAVWQKSQTKFEWEEATRQRVEKKIGMELLADKDRRAFAQLEKVTLPDEDVRAGKLRAALITPDWQQLERALSGLTEAERKESRAQYWQGRMLEETDRRQQAEAVFQALASDRSFYGFLAADKINAPYALEDKPVKAEAEALEELTKQPDFAACREFHFFNRETEIRRQWQFAISRLPKEKLSLAAKLAQSWQWDQLAITTLVKAGYWDDLGIRFPVRYAGDVHKAAQQYGLNPALIMGLIRQESMLDAKAKSAVGALGLMQMMPTTARMLAPLLKQPQFKEADLLQPTTNITFGAYYLNDLVARLGHRLPAAIAAYNAGPGKVKTWLPSGESVPADIWIDTIPYKETRKYVANVLAYAIIYQDRLKSGVLKLQDLLAPITPQQKSG